MGGRLPQARRFHGRAQHLHRTVAVLRGDPVVGHHPQAAAAEVRHQHALLARARGASARPPLAPGSLKTTMLVSTRGRVEHDAGERATPSARICAFAWSSASRSTISVSATMPGGGDDAGLPHAAAEHLAHPARPVDERRRPADHRARPAPPSPFDRHSCTDETCRVQSVTGRPAATAALNSRAPSRCTGRPCRPASAATSAKYVRRQDRAAAAVVRVLEADHAGRRVVVEVVVVRRQVDGRLERVERQRPVGVGAHRVQHEAAERRRADPFS